MTHAELIALAKEFLVEYSPQEVAYPLAEAFLEADEERERLRLSAASRKEVTDTLYDALVRVVTERDALKAENERLRDAVANGLELFDNYGFADESPCARDREIIATMREAIGKQPAGTHFSEVSQQNEKLRAERDAARAEVDSLRDALEENRKVNHSLWKEIEIFRRFLTNHDRLQAELSALRAEIEAGSVVFWSKRDDAWHTRSEQDEHDTHRARLMRIEKIGPKER